MNDTKYKKGKFWCNLKLDYIFQYKYQLYIILLLIFFITSVIFLYPKTELTMGVGRWVLEMLDENGKIRKENEKNGYYLLQNKLKEKGINLIYKSQDSDQSAKPLLQFLVENPQKIDFTFADNWGGEFPISSVKMVSSLGTIAVTPFIFIVRSPTKIHHLKDLKGKKIAFYSSPEGRSTPVFTNANEKASAYSSDIFLEKFFKLAGVTIDNSKLINYWPNKISINDDWDILLAYNHPLPNGSRSLNEDLYKGLLKHEIKFLEFDDAEAIVKNLPQSKLLKIPQSLFNPKDNYPDESFKAIGITSSVYVQNNMDPSHVLILSQVLKDLYGRPGYFKIKDEYPNFSAIEMFEPNQVAVKYYQEGENSILNRYFPPIFSAFLGKLLFILAPILIIAIPLTTVIPGALKKYFQLKINNYYNEIYSIEKIVDDGNHLDFELIFDRLEKLDFIVGNIKLPLVHDDFVQQLFIVREHIFLIRRKLDRIHQLAVKK
jgi:hypothetical protein